MQDVGPYVNECPYTVFPDTSVPQVFNLFRSMGLRHLPVVGHDGKVTSAYRCHYTKSNPIDDQNNISSKRLQKQNFKPLGHYTCMQCGTSHLQKNPRKHTATYHFSDLQEVYSDNRQIHTKCQLQYLHPPHI